MGGVRSSSEPIGRGSIIRCGMLTRKFFEPGERPDLAHELHKGALFLEKAVRRTLLLHQQEALICLFSDVIGHHAYPQWGTLERSDLIHHLNSGMFQLAAAEFSRFTYINGRIDKRLWEKRECERLWFSRGVLMA